MSPLLMFAVLGLSAILMGYGVYLAKKGKNAKMPATLIGAGIFMGVFALSYLGFGREALATTTASTSSSLASAGEKGMGYIGAALAVGLSALGAGIGVASTGAATIGAMSEKPEMMGKSLVFVGLAEGIAIYGVVIAIMILSKL